MHDSPLSHRPSPHWGQAPQSVAHVLHDSVVAQTPSPHRAEQPPQSAGQFVQLSPGILHAPSPQRPGHGLQSAGHVAQVSPGAVHVPSPHRGVGGGEEAKQLRPHRMAWPQPSSTERHSEAFAREPQVTGWQQESSMPLGLSTQPAGQVSV